MFDSKVHRICQYKIARVSGNQALFGTVPTGLIVSVLTLEEIFWHRSTGFVSIKSERFSGDQPLIGTGPGGFNISSPTLEEMFGAIDLGRKRTLITKDQEKQWNHRYFIHGEEHSVLLYEGLERQCRVKK